jgi:hypothetical protein
MAPPNIITNPLWPTTLAAVSKPSIATIRKQSAMILIWHDETIACGKS